VLKNFTKRPIIFTQTDLFNTSYMDLYLQVIDAVLKGQSPYQTTLSPSEIHKNQKELYIFASSM
jgi:hypothetical protein